MADFVVTERMPTVDEHRALFEAVGWNPYAPEAASLALRNTLCGVVVHTPGDVNDIANLIGMGRVIGDGGKFFYIQDVAVRPAFQGQGVGRLIMDRLLAYIKRSAPHEPFVGLFATEVAWNFYKHYGFEPRTEVLSGMWNVLPVDNRAEHPDADWPGE